MLYTPKNAFAGHEYVPYDVPEKKEGLFGDDDDDDGPDDGPSTIEEEGDAEEGEQGDHDGDHVHGGDDHGSL